MKKVVKLLIISVLVFVCAMGLIACGDNSNSETDQGIVCRKFSGDNFYTVVSYNKKDGETELDISKAAQDKYGDTVIVGRIRKGAFDGNETLKKVIVSDKAGDGVDLTIDEGAFKNMRALESITLPFVGANKNSDAYYNESEPAENKAVDKERSFGYIFGEEENDNSSAMTFSYGDKSDMTATFYIPVALKEIIIDADEEINIPMYAFCGAPRFVSVTLKGNIKAIGTSAFKNMTGVKTIEIPVGVTAIYENAFEGATALLQLNYAGTKMQWSAVNGVEEGLKNSEIKKIVCSDGEILLGVA